jgi:hypothetical protein
MDVGAHLVCEAGVAVELAVAPADAWAIGGTIGGPRRADAGCIGLTASLLVVIIAKRHRWLGTLQARESTACLATRVHVAGGAARSSGSSGSTRTAGRPRPSGASRRLGGGVFTAAERCKERTSYGDPHCTSGLKRGSSLMLFHAHPFRPVRESTDRAKASGHVRSGEIPGECASGLGFSALVPDTRVHSSSGVAPRSQAGPRAAYELLRARPVGALSRMAQRERLDTAHWMHHISGIGPYWSIRNPGVGPFWMDIGPVA